VQPCKNEANNFLNQVSPNEHSEYEKKKLGYERLWHIVALARFPSSKLLNFLPVTVNEGPLVDARFGLLPFGPEPANPKVTGSPIQSG
jgi:hypothetical protein